MSVVAWSFLDFRGEKKKPHEEFSKFITTQRNAFLQEIKKDTKSPELQKGRHGTEREYPPVGYVCPFSVSVANCALKQETCVFNRIASFYALLKIPTWRLARTLVGCCGTALNSVPSWLAQRGSGKDGPCPPVCLAVYSPLGSPWKWRLAPSRAPQPTPVWSREGLPPLNRMMEYSFFLLPDKPWL